MFNQLHRQLALLITAFAFSFINHASAAEVTGAGSSFVYPILSKWASVYKDKAGTAVNYQSIGSGGGIKQIESKTVDFGATDMPLKPEELSQNGLIQFPIINGAVVPIVNISGVAAGNLKLTGPLLADIFMGKIKKWNDSAIAKINVGTNLPDKDITVVHRSDGSGTTFIFSNYLSKISADWKGKIGEGTAINWTTGLGAKGNEGVASNVKQVDGSIGYVEYAYAIQNSLAYVQLKNKAGKFVQPEMSSFQAAAAGTDWSKTSDFYAILTDAPGAKSWPIAGSTFILMQKNPENPEHIKEVLKFFSWAYKNGSTDAVGLHYVPIPEKTAKAIEKYWSDHLKSIDMKSL
jgi:phosphate transport system substrate-binding protein